MAAGREYTCSNFPSSLNRPAPDLPDRLGELFDERSSQFLSETTSYSRSR